MRLYLSSFRLGDHSHVVRAMVPQPSRIALIGNACDAAAPKTRRELLQIDRIQLAELGYLVEELDLRDYSDPAGTRSALVDFPAVYVRGGNTFVLREALARSGADHALTELLADDALVYAGYSAAGCVRAPDLHGLERCDPLTGVTEAFADDPLPRFTGLGVLDRHVVPHLDSAGHPESELLGEVARVLDGRGTPYWALRDGDVLVVDGSRQEVLPRLHDRPRGRLG